VSALATSEKIYTGYKEASMLTAEDNEEIGDRGAVELNLQVAPIVEFTARAMEVFGTREKALAWLNTPVRSPVRRLFRCSTRPKA